MASKKKQKPKMQQQPSQPDDSTYEIQWVSEVAPLQSLKPHPRNPRTMSRKDFDGLIDSIEESGFYNPIIVDHDFTILAGHGRHRALKRLKHKTVDIRRPAAPLPEDIARRILAADNLSFGRWDMDILLADNELTELVQWNFDETVLADVLEPPIEEETPDKKTDSGEKDQVTCPECSHVFEP